MIFDGIVPHEILFLDCDRPWGPRVAAACENHHLQVRRMQVHSGFDLVNWREVAAVILGSMDADTNRIVAAIRYLARWHPHVVSLVDIAGDPSMEWAVREAGASWTFESIYEIDAISRIIHHLVRAANQRSQPTIGANSSGSWQRHAEGCVAQALGPIIGYDAVREG